MNSILTSVKKFVGVAEEDESFDVDVIMDINSAFAIVSQLGAGPQNGFSIYDKTALWSDFVSEVKVLNMVKTYICLKVKLVFDPPSSAPLLESMMHQLGELEFRIMVNAEEV